MNTDFSSWIQFCRKFGWKKIIFRVNFDAVLFALRGEGSSIANCLSINLINYAECSSRLQQCTDFYWLPLSLALPIHKERLYFKNFHQGIDVQIEVMNMDMYVHVYSHNLCTLYMLSTCMYSIVYIHVHVRVQWQGICIRKIYMYTQEMTSQLIFSAD